jgi:hypothetical protein
VAALTLVIAAACTASDDDARPVTVAESRLLAELRVRNADAGSRAITATYTDRGRETTLTGWFDYTTRTGYGTVSADGLPSDRVTWNGELVATSGGTRTRGTQPLTSLDGWTAARLDPSGSRLAVVLTVLAGLGSDRPDDARLVREGGALWLREDETGGTPVTVFAGPGSDAIRYWVDDDGLAHRVDVRLGDEWAEVTFENDDVAVPPLLSGVDVDTKGGGAAADAASG